MSKGDIGSATTGFDADKLAVNEENSHLSPPEFFSVVSGALLSPAFAYLRHICVGLVN